MSQKTRNASFHFYGSSRSDVIRDLSRDFLTNIAWLLQSHGSNGRFHWFITATKALQKSIEFQNETYDNIKKDITEKKRKLETDNRNNEEVQKLIQQNTEMKEQTAEL